MSRAKLLNGRLGHRQAVLLRPLVARALDGRERGGQLVLPVAGIGTEHLDHVAAELNDRSRARLQDKSPNQLMQQWEHRLITTIIRTITRNRPGSSGRFCHSTMPSTTLSVMVEIVCRDTSAP